MRSILIFVYSFYTPTAAHMADRMENLIFSHNSRHYVGSSQIRCFQRNAVLFKDKGKISEKVWKKLEVKLNIDSNFAQSYGITSIQMHLRSSVIYQGSLPPIFLLHPPVTYIFESDLGPLHSDSFLSSLE